MNASTSWIINVWMNKKVNYYNLKEWSEYMNEWMTVWMSKTNK